MRNLRSVALSRKLPVIIAGISLLASLTVAVLGYLDFRRSTLHEVKRHFNVLTATRGAELESWFQELEKDMRAYVRMPSVVNATQALSSSFALLPEGGDLQMAYIANNPNPMGQKGLLDQAPEAIPYNFQHGAFHPFFRELLQNGGYYDVFLFNLDGDIIYSYAKEPDFATNVVTGPYRESGLGSAFRAARDGSPGQVHFADFAIYQPRGETPAAFMAAPVRNAEGIVVGIYAVQLPTSQIELIVNRPLGLGTSGEMYIAGPDDRTRSTSRFEGGHLPLHDVSALVHLNSDTTDPDSFMTEVTGISGKRVIAQVADLDVMGQTWQIVGELDIAEVMLPVIAMRNKLALFSGIVMAVAAGLGYLTARSVVRPLERLRNGMGRVANRDYAFVVADTDRDDELGVLANALVDFRDKLSASDAAEEDRKKVQAEQARVVEELTKGMIALADGDLTAMIHKPFDPSYEQLRIDYNRTVANLNATVGSVVNSAVGIRERALEMSSASDDLSRRTENQAATLEQTAAALDELTASVRSAAEGAREVETIVANAQHDANASEPVVQKAVAAMTAIEKSSNEISQIVGVIDDIAFQTNLLALNAGVEAARAGDAGRGFAVVASEVRALAQRSSEAAKQIKSLIAGSSDQVASGVGLVGQAGEVLTRIAKHIGHISGLISEIASGAAEQSTGLAEINIGVTQLDKVTQQNAAMVEQATASSHALNAEAGNLGDLVARFHLAAGEGAFQGGGSGQSDNVMMFQSPRRQHQFDVPEARHPQAAMSGTYGRVPTATADEWQDF
jgi:methyl-accepting chemotaxis protein